MAKEIKLNFSDFRDQRDVQKKMGLTSIEYINHMRKHTQQQGMGDREFEKFVAQALPGESGTK